MSKKFKYIIQGILFILIIVAFIYIGTKDFSTKVIVDNEKFDQEYHNVSSDNVFVYASSQEVYTMLKNGSGIIFMGYPENKWSGYYANLLNETAKSSGIKEILYYNFYNDRKMKNATYQSIVLNLVEYLPMLDDGTHNIYAPTLIIVKNGHVIAYDNETALNVGTINPENYWDEYHMSSKIASFQKMFNKYLGKN